MQTTRRFLGVALALVSLGCSSPRVTQPPESPQEKPLSDIVLRLPDYPKGFELAEQVSIDITEPFTAASSCRSIGIPPNRVLEALVLGDSVGLGNPESPPATGAGTAAMRVQDERDLRTFLDELQSPKGKNCLRDELNVNGVLRLTTHDIGSVQTMTVIQASNSEGFGFVLVVRGTTVAVGLVASLGKRFDSPLLRSIASQLVERVA